MRSVEATGSATPPPPDRRPIAARDHALWRAVAGWLVVRGVSANVISIVGMLACVIAGGCLAFTAHASGLAERGLWIAAGVLVPFRLVCNMLDGMVAIGRGESSAVGELYNEIPDRLSDMAALVGLGFAAAAHPTLGVFAAALAVLVAYVRAAAKVAGARQDYCGPMAKQQRMVVVIAVCLWMGCVPVDWRTMGDRSIAGIPLSVPNVGLMVIAIGSVITVVRRVRRAAAELSGSPRR